MSHIFDAHFHLLFKHYIATGFTVTQPVRMNGVAAVLNDLFGGPFDSQSCPKQVGDSRLHLGITSLISVEYAFAERILHLAGIDFSGLLPINKDIIKNTKGGKVTYLQGFKDQIAQHLNQAALLKATYRINFLNRKDWQGKTEQEIRDALADGERYFALSIEGGHNLSDVPIRGPQMARNPEVRLREIQDDPKVDFISLNLCHLSDICEQRLGGFAHGVNKMGSVAFNSEDFSPKHPGLGLTQLGKKVIVQALTHPQKPILIDVKHMSLYTRLHYYKFREQLFGEYPQTRRLPIICSHTGLTFTTVAEYLEKKRFRSTVVTEDGRMISKIEPEHRRIGKTDDLINKRLFCNPWSINLFDEEIVEIIDSGGLIGFSLDQRILGAANPALDSARDEYYEEEYIAGPEWEKMFRDGQLPTAGEGLRDLFEGIKPSKEERHSMLLCLHLVHAVRVGYANLAWDDGTSPWDRLCIGSDFDGFINPINGVDDVTQLDQLRADLRKYLPRADRFSLFLPEIKALEYHENGTVDQDFLTGAIEKFMFDNGHQFITRFLRNWKP